MPGRGVAGVGLLRCAGARRLKAYRGRRPCLHLDGHNGQRARHEPSRSAMASRVAPVALAVGDRLDRRGRGERPSHAAARAGQLRKHLYVAAARVCSMPGAPCACVGMVHHQARQSGRAIVEPHCAALRQALTCLCDMTGSSGVRRRRPHEQALSMMSTLSYGQRGAHGAAASATERQTHASARRLGTLRSQ